MNTIANKNTKKLKIKEIDVLKRSAINGSNTAIRASKAIGLTVKLISNNKIIEKRPNGEKTILRQLDNVSISQKGLKKGMILCKK